MNVLIISPYFPPFTGVGVLRPSSLVSYLVQRGECVTVLKLEDASYDPRMSTGPRLLGPSYVEFPLGEREEETASLFSAVLEQLLERTSFDCCLITCDPFYTLPPALTLTKRHSIPLAIDYRDLWLYHTNPATTLRGFLGRYYYRFRLRAVEASFMEGCAAFSTVTPRLLGIMERHYPVLRGKSVCIYNGYECLPVKEQRPAQGETGEIRLFVMGKFSYYTRRGAEMFLRAAARLLRKGYPVRVVHAGAPENLEPLLQRTGFPAENFEEAGPLPYEEAMAAAAAARVGIIIVAGRYGIATKLFDYVYLNKPIVAVVSGGSEMEELLSGKGNAFFCQTARQCEAAIERIIREDLQVLTDDAEFRGRFSREAQNRRFHQLLKDISKAKG